MTSRQYLVTGCFYLLIKLFIKLFIPNSFIYKPIVHKHQHTDIAMK